MATSMYLYLWNNLYFINIYGEKMAWVLFSSRRTLYPNICAYNFCSCLNLTEITSKLIQYNTCHYFNLISTLAFLSTLISFVPQHISTVCPINWTSHFPESHSGHSPVSRWQQYDRGPAEIRPEKGKNFKEICNFFVFQPNSKIFIGWAN